MTTPHTATRRTPHHARTATCDAHAHARRDYRTLTRPSMHRMHTAQESEHTDHSHGAGRVHSDRNSSPDATRDTRRLTLTHRAHSTTVRVCTHQGARSQHQNSSCLPLPDIGHIGPSLLSIDHSRDSRSHPPVRQVIARAQLLPLLRHCYRRCCCSHYRRHGLERCIGHGLERCSGHQLKRCCARGSSAGWTRTERRRHLCASASAEEPAATAAGLPYWEWARAPAARLR